MTTVKERRARRSSTSPTGSRTGGCAAGETSLPRGRRRPHRPLRAVAYVRESTEEQGQGFSPDAQRQAIRRFAPENDLELVERLLRLPFRLAQADGRPEFQRLMADAAERRFDVVLVYHTSRFARNQVEARRYKQLLREQLGIRVISVTQPIGDDPTDPSAFLAESIHEMFDEYYSVSLSFWTKHRTAREGPARPSRRHAPVGLCPRRDTDSRSPTRSGRRSCASCSSATRPATSPTARSPRGSTQRRAHREGPAIRQGHGARDARQRRLLRLRLRAAQQGPLDQGPARAARRAKSCSTVCRRSAPGAPAS